MKNLKLRKQYIQEELAWLEAGAPECKEPWLKWQWYSDITERWVDLIGAPSWVHDRYRKAPEFILINGINVPKPLEELPEDDETDVWLVDITYTALVSRLDARYILAGRSHLIKSGLCHLTKEAAETHAKALLSFTKQD